MSGDKAGDREGRSSCETSDQQRLEGTAQRTGPGEATFHETEARQRCHGDQNRYDQPQLNARDEDVGCQRYQPPSYVSPPDRQSALHRSARIRLLKTELISHHEVDPGFWAVSESLDDRRDLSGFQAIRSEDRFDLGYLVLRLFNDLPLFAGLFT